jgi:hypothetical protein
LDVGEEEGEGVAGEEEGAAAGGLNDCISIVFCCEDSIVRLTRRPDRRPRIPPYSTPRTASS